MQLRQGVDMQLQGVEAPVSGFFPGRRRCCALHFHRVAMQPQSGQRCVYRHPSHYNLQRSREDRRNHTGRLKAPQPALPHHLRQFD